MVGTETRVVATARSMVGTETRVVATARSMGRAETRVGERRRPRARGRLPLVGGELAEERDAGAHQPLRGPSVGY
jgi:hypothetical protein